MLYNLANAIANIKSGYLTKRLIVRCTPNIFVKRVLQKLTDEGFIRGYGIDNLDFHKLKIYLKYDENFSSVIRNIKIISTSGKRVYFSSRRVLEAYNKNEIFIITTTKGLFTTNEIVYNRLNIGGEVVLQVFLY